MDCCELPRRVQSLDQDSARYLAKNGERSWRQDFPIRTTHQLENT
jgi:hypothetical protein